MPLRIRESYYKPTEDVLTRYLWEQVFQPIIDIVERYEGQRVNSIDAVTDALRRGAISYANGEFSGDFTRQISSTLSEFADFDSRSGTWKVKNVAQIPPNITAAATVARDQAIRMTREIEQSIGGLSERIEYTIRNLGLPIDGPLFAMDRELKKDVGDLTVVPEITSRMADELIKDYTENQHLNIKNWAPDQIERLRDMVQRHALNGYRRGELMDMIASEWGVTDRKAKFLARQETGLFMSKLRRERFKDAGIRRYRWSTSQDERVRNRHSQLHGQVFAFGQPPITDDKGNRNEPGEDYNCRCVAIPIL